MSQIPLADAYRCLDLPVNAPPLQVERAFRRKQALYGEAVLATYSLLDAGGRQALLDRLEAAYRLISADRGRALAPLAVTTGAAAEEPDPATCPGRFLQVRREAAGLTLREVAARTKVSPMRLAQIEAEQHQALPAPVYLRGFVVAFARALGLPDADTLGQHFLARHREQVSEA
ncbi:MAG: helix-turn-helix domain-containing protein [Desulfuromonadales bacterium]|nr:helix-turn-helix domain-containing protein [Desulfuromonadales bacterium]